MSSPAPGGIARAVARDRIVSVVDPESRHAVNRSAADASLYEATRYAWKLNVNKAKKADVVLSTRQGLIVGAFIATQC